MQHCYILKQNYMNLTVFFQYIYIMLSSILEKNELFCDFILMINLTISHVY